MKNFKLILMVALALAVSSGKVFAGLADDIWGGINTATNGWASGAVSGGWANDAYSAVSSRAGLAGTMLQVSTNNILSGLNTQTIGLKNDLQIYGAALGVGAAGVGGIAGGLAGGVYDTWKGGGSLFYKACDIGAVKLAAIDKQYQSAGIGNKLTAESAARLASKIIPGAGSALPFVAPQVIAARAYAEKLSSTISGLYKPVKINNNININ